MNFPGKTLLPYFTAGWPDPERFLEGVQGAAEAGCKAFEIGIPFTDPVADGPVVQRTSKQALESGVSLDRALELMQEATRRSGLAAVAMTYANLIYRQGVDNVCRRLYVAGARGLIIPDVPLEEGEMFERAASEAGLDFIYLCAPNTPLERVKLLAERTRGFLYLVSVKGVTGARSELPAELGQLIRDVKERCDKPVFVGFGISRPDQVAEITRSADGAIVGSALLERIEQMQPGQDRAGVREYLAGLQAATQKPV